ncbi:MAG: dihydrofolate reductase [Paracoccus sp. (in: a-proteobacteria)]
MLTLIVARARNGAIGKNGSIPWYLPEDLKLFQRETTGGALIMGRRTWESLPVRPLKNRLNCVLTRQVGYAEHSFTTADDAIRFCRSEGYYRIYGIGGEGIYRELLHYADRLLITEVDTEVPDADAFFPEFDRSEWKEIISQPLTDTAQPSVLYEFIRKI